tara:strand:- start:581 stop:1237 length:657 start_codon:yes stop_codon:yes gene_type:complete
MRSNFSNRSLTSIILLTVLFIGLSFNKFIWLYLLIVASIICFYEFFYLIKKRFKKKNKKIYLYNFFSLVYLLLLIFVSYNLYDSSSISLVLILLICIFSDTGGYIIGKLIGGKKLTKISPKKTISGSIGSFVFSIFPIIILSFFFEESYQSEDLSMIVFICLFLSLICQLGDLFISYFKRQAKVKDTGSLLPGHGGLLDRIDGIIFVLPAAYLIDKLL